MPSVRRSDVSNKERQWLLAHIDFQPLWVEYSVPVDVRLEWSDDEVMKWCWWVTVRLTTEGDRLVVSALSVHPARPGTKMAHPAGGLHGRLLREIRLAEIVEQAHKRLRNKAGKQAMAFVSDGPLLPEVATMMFQTVGRLAQASQKGSGRVARDDTFYAAWAALWDDKLASGSRRPRAELAEEHPEIGGHAQVRDVVHEARRRGFLRWPRPNEKGLAVGGLTDKARALLGGQETE